MKKRRDLDALVNGKLGGRRKKNGQHELLRNTDSSDIEEFAIPPQNLARKHRSPSRFCSTCLAVCGFFLLTACAVAVAGLVWVHIELKKNVDLLQIRLSTVENGNAGNTVEFQGVHTQIKTFTNEIQELKAKTDSFEKNFTAVWQKLNQLSSQSEKLPQTPNPEIAGMKTTVASLGSELESLKASTTQEFDRIQKTLSAYEQVTPQMEQRSFPDLVSVKTDIFGIQQNISLLNATIIQRITNLRRERELVTGQMNASLGKLEDRLSIVELRPITEPTVDRNMQETIHEAVRDALMSPERNSQVSDLQAAVNNMTLEMDGVKLVNKLLNTSVTSNQQQVNRLDKKVEEHETRLGMLENSQTLNKAPPDRGQGSPPSSSPDASTAKKPDSPVSTHLTDPPTEHGKPTQLPAEEKDGDTSREVPVPPGFGSYKPKPSDQDVNQDEKDNWSPGKQNKDEQLDSKNDNNQYAPPDSGNAQSENEKGTDYSKGDTPDNLYDDNYDYGKDQDFGVDPLENTDPENLGEFLRRKYDNVH